MTDKSKLHFEKLQFKTGFGQIVDIVAGPW